MCRKLQRNPKRSCQFHVDLVWNDPTYKNPVLMDEIPPEMIKNGDHTGINYAPMSSWTMEKVGLKCVEIIGKMIKDS